MIEIGSGEPSFLDGRRVFRMSRGPIKSRGKALGKRTMAIFIWAGRAGEEDGLDMVVRGFLALMAVVIWGVEQRQRLTDSDRVMGTVYQTADWARRYKSMSGRYIDIELYSDGLARLVSDLSHRL